MMRFFYEELVMRNTKLKKMIILSVGIMFLFILGIIILYQTPYAPKTFFPTMAGILLFRFWI